MFRWCCVLEWESFLGIATFDIHASFKALICLLCLSTTPVIRSDPAGFAALMLFRGFFPGLVTISDKLTPALFCSTYCVYSEQKNTNVGSQDLLNLWKAGFYLRVGLLYSGPCFCRHSVFCFKEKEKGESLRGGVKEIAELVFRSVYWILPSVRR